MKSPLIAAAAASLLLSACMATGAANDQAIVLAAAPLSAPEAAVEPPKKADGTYMAPGEIVAAAPASDWVRIAPEDLLVMDLAPDGKGRTRRVVIQLIPAPFSIGWTENIRKLAAAQWWDGTSINRVQDNYVVQWGDATEEKPLPDGLAVMTEADYVTAYAAGMMKQVWSSFGRKSIPSKLAVPEVDVDGSPLLPSFSDPYTLDVAFVGGFPVGIENDYSDDGGKPEDVLTFPGRLWPVHCYGMVGVGRNLSPDTGTGAELYTVIGHAPRHLDRNIALVGRVIAGIEHLSSLPRGTGALGFYETEEERTPILSVRLATELPGDKPLPPYEYLSTESASFMAYADARANRRDPFFKTPAGGADICNIPVPIRPAP